MQQYMYLKRSTIMLLGFNFGPVHSDLGKKVEICVKIKKKCQNMNFNEHAIHMR
jgi:hypothetical protein